MFDKNYSKVISWILVGLFFLGVIVSFVFSYNKYLAVGYHPVDYSFYLQFATKAFNHHYTQEYSITPIGANMFGLGGFDGFGGLHHGMHLELIKYVEAVIYWLFNTPLALFLFVAIIYFAPLLYWAKIFKPKDKAEAIFSVLTALFYCLAPSVLAAVTYDLRPFALLAPGFLCFFLAVYWRRPSWEIFLFFNILFLLREEGVYFGFIIIIYYWLNYYLGSAFIKKRFIQWLGLNYLIWCGLLFWYMRWSGFKVIDRALARFYGLQSFFVHYWIILLVISVVGLIILGWLYFKILPRYKDSLIKWLPAAWLFFGLFGPSLMGAAKVSFNSLNHWQAWYLPRFNILIPFIIFLFFSLSQWFDTRGNKILLKIIIFLVIISFLLSVFPLAGSSVNYWLKYQEQKKEASIVWQIREVTDKYKTHILVDTDLHQIFSDYENVHSLDCLPIYLEKNDAKRCRPEINDYLKQLISSQIEYIAFSRSKEPVVLELLKGLPIVIKEKSQNSQFAVFKLR